MATKLTAKEGVRVLLFGDDSEHNDQWVIIGRKADYVVGSGWRSGGYHLQNQETGELTTVSRRQFELAGRFIEEQVQEALFEIEEC